MKNAGADILVAGIENTGMRTLMDEAKRQGLDVIPCSRTANDNAELTKQGNIFDDGLPPCLHPQLPGQPGHGPGDVPGAHGQDRRPGVGERSIYGWINAALADQGLAQAGWPGTTRDWAADQPQSMSFD